MAKVQEKEKHIAARDKTIAGDNICIYIFVYIHIPTCLYVLIYMYIIVHIFT